jgi:RimJ/RimL family protein N-acetyltransferase
MALDLQPTLQNDIALLLPLQASDYDALFAVAADPAIWAQHPKHDRWKEEVFRPFFNDAIASQGAFRIIDKATGQVAGSTRFYSYHEQESIVFIGYTFYATKYWGTGFNPSVKQLMLDHAFQSVNKVGLHVGEHNIRSQIAVGRLGAVKVAEEEESPGKLNYIYHLSR